MRIILFILLLTFALPSFAIIQVVNVPTRANIFEEAYKDIAGIHINTDNIQDIFPHGMVALIAKSENLKIVEGKYHYTLLQGSKIRARYPIPPPNDAYEWGAITALIIDNAQTLSPRLQNLNDDQIYEVFFDGIMRSLDKFSRYRTPIEAKAYLQNGVKNKCRHLGLVIAQKNREYIAKNVQAQSPAYEIGMRKNDVIHMINKKNIKNEPIEDVYRALCGSTKNKIEILFENSRGDLLTEFISKKILLKPSIKFSLHNDILFLKIKKFSPLTDRELKTVFDTVQNHTVKGVVLDLRQNRGGLLDQAVKISDAFLDKGLILQTKGKHFASNQVFHAKDPVLLPMDVPMVILIDDYTASSAEIVTEALKDHGRGIIMGHRTYGKGVVQAVTKLPNEGELFLTWSNIISPSGDSFHISGIRPLFCHQNPDKSLCQTMAVKYVESPIEASNYLLTHPEIYNQLLSHQTQVNQTIQ